MVDANFPESLSRVLKHEGGYTNDPQDRGGPTNWGITIEDARMYWKPNATASDVRAMPLEIAKGIYRTKYWDRMKCDQLPSGVDYCTFDYGVNSGVNRALRILGLYQNKEPAALIEAMCDERLAFLQSLHTWPTFGKGWARRVADVRQFSLVLAQTGGPVPAPLPPDIPVPEPIPQKTFWQYLFEFIINLFRRK